MTDSDVAFYTTAAQIAPILLLAVLVEGRLLSIARRETSRLLGAASVGMTSAFLLMVMGVALTVLAVGSGPAVWKALIGAALAWASAQLVWGLILRVRRHDDV